MNKSVEEARVENEWSESRRQESESEQTQGRKTQRVAYRKTQRRGSNRQYSGGEDDARFHHRIQLLHPWSTAISLVWTQKGVKLWVITKSSQGTWKPRWGERTVLSYSHSKSLQVRDPQDRNFCQSGLNAMYTLLAPQWADMLERAETREDWETLDHSHSSLQEMRSAAPSCLRTHTECRFHQIRLSFH